MSETAVFHFRGDLHLLLPAGKRQASHRLTLRHRQTVKHWLETLRIPHTEVEALKMNGRFLPFDYVVASQDEIVVYPATALPPDVDLLRLHPPLPEPIRFLLDVHLGRLATYLRLLGFDTANHEVDPGDPALAQQAHEEQRVMLTRDRGLLKRNIVTWGYLLRTRNSQQQLLDVLARFDLADKQQPWTRCLKCNGRLRPVPKAEILDRLEPKTIKYYDQFHLCTACEQIYWKGSHYRALEDLVAKFAQEQQQKNQF